MALLDGDTAAPALRAMRYDEGTGWSSFLDALPAAEGSLRTTLAIGPEGLPTVAWETYDGPSATLGFARASGL